MAAGSDPAPQHGPEREQGAGRVVHGRHDVGARHRFDAERCPQRPPAGQGCGHDGAHAPPGVQAEGEAVTHEDRCQQPHEERVHVQVAGEQQRGGDPCSPWPAPGRPGDVEGGDPLSGERVGPEGAGCDRCGTQRQRRVDLGAAQAVRAALTQPGSPRSAGPDRVLGQQVGADQRGVVLPERDAGPGRAPTQRGADDLPPIRRVAIAVERVRAAGDPADVFVEQGGGLTARRQVGHRPGGEQQDCIGVDTGRSGPHRLLDRGCGVHRVGLEGQLGGHVTFPRDDDRRAGAASERHRRAGDLGWLVAEPHEGGHRRRSAAAVVRRQVVGCSGRTGPHRPAWRAERHHQRGTAPHQGEAHGRSDEQVARGRGHQRCCGERQRCARGERPGRSAEALRHVRQVSLRAQASA